jgi:thioredoxin reductase (NADPH)
MSTSFIHPVIIIGSGPAGLTAGIYTSRAFLKPLVFQGKKPGGQLMGTSFVENWPGIKSIMGPKLMIDIQEQLKELGGTLVDETIVSVDFTQRPFTITSNKQTYQAHSVIIATGSSPNTLGCPGENEYWGKGVTTCAICDGAFYPDKKVVIVGGGDTAMETASFMSKYTKDITIVHILDKLTASPIMQRRVLDTPTNTFIYSSTIKEIKGNGTTITSVLVENITTKKITELSADVLFLAIGSKPNTTPFQGQLPLDAMGYISLPKGSNTPIEGVFVAGDVSDYKYKQAVVSAGAGCMAALDAQRYLEHKGLI